MAGPLAYHITFGTYGTRLHGDERGTVDRGHNRHGEPIIGECKAWRWAARNRLAHPPVVLARLERLFVEEALPRVCLRGGWLLHMCAAQEDHVHVMLTASADGAAVRRWLKRWLSQALTRRFPGAVPRPGPDGATPEPARRVEARAVWWAEGGSVKWVWDQAYFTRVFTYVQAQRASG